LHKQGWHSECRERNMDMIAPNTEPTLLTIGYEGLDLPGFVKYLTWHKVEVLVDVRELPISRKKGFSKSALTQAMAAHGIGYEHIKALGSPGPIRKQLKVDWDYETFFSAYEDYLNGQTEALDTLTELIEENRRVCLLCFEKAHEECHRSRVANRMERAFDGHLTVEPVKTWV